jgi:hypothetical protein
MNNLRLGWVWEFQRSPPVDIIQVRGDVDEHVAADDSRDLYRFGAYETVVPGLRHMDFMHLPQGNSQAYKTVFEAFCAPYSAPATTQQPVKATNLVFLVHGIRDFADWHENLSYELKNVDPDARIVSVRYGYFSLLQFLLSSQRQWCVRSFADFYIQECAKTEVEKKIIVAAHSNGTYAFAHALRAFPDIRSDRVYLAGSVLPRRFRWNELEAQVTEIRNDCANWDWPVGCLCNGLRFLPWLWGKIGTGGFLGFIPPPARATRSNAVLIYQNQYLEGDHGAAFQPQYHRDLANYLINGSPLGLTSRAKLKPAMAVLHVLSYLIVPFAFLLVALAVVELGNFGNRLGQIPTISRAARNVVSLIAGFSFIPGLAGSADLSAAILMACAGTIVLTVFVHWLLLRI